MKTGFSHTQYFTPPLPKKINVTPLAIVAGEQHPSVHPGGGEDDRVRQPQLPLLAQQHRLLRDADVDLENMEPGEKTPDTYDS